MFLRTKSYFRFTNLSKKTFLNFSNQKKDESTTSEENMKANEKKSRMQRLIENRLKVFILFEKKFRI